MTNLKTTTTLAPELLAVALFNARADEVLAGSRGFFSYTDVCRDAGATKREFSSVWFCQLASERGLQAHVQGKYGWCAALPLKHAELAEVGAALAAKREKKRDVEIASPEEIKRETGIDVVAEAEAALAKFGARGPNFSALQSNDVERLKQEDRFAHAGALAFALGHDETSYGCHYGMRSTNDRARDEFRQGWRGAEHDCRLTARGIETADETAIRDRKQRDFESGVLRQEQQARAARREEKRATTERQQTVEMIDRAYPVERRERERVIDVVIAKRENDARRLRRCPLCRAGERHLACR